MYVHHSVNARHIGIFLFLAFDIVHRHTQPEPLALLYDRVLWRVNGMAKRVLKQED